MVVLRQLKLMKHQEKCTISKSSNSISWISSNQDIRTEHSLIVAESFRI
jgi:hypothetical protein